MTLRRLERLIQEARLSSNTQDIDTISDQLLVLYSNRVQSMVEDRLFMASSSSGLFQKDYKISLISGVTEYDLPFDIYAKNAIKSVGVSLEAHCKEKIPFISESESGSWWGYSLREDKISLNLQRSSALPVVVTYVRKIPSLGLRFGALTTAPTINTITVGTTVDDILSIDDYFCTVDVDGTVISRGNLITSYDKVTGIITFTAGDVSPSSGEYVIPGKYATSHSQLPLETEKIFLEVLERRIAQRQSASDMGVITPLTDDEIALVDSVFAKGSEDNEVPPIMDYREYC